MPRGGKRLCTTDGKKNNIGERVKQKRKELKLTQDALNGRIAFVTEGKWNPAPQEILHVERGSRIVSDLEVIALAAALECDPAWLLLGT